MKLENPAPWASEDPGLPFGSTEPPYSKNRRHGGKDWQWRYADPYQSRRVVAPVSGVIVHIEDGWGVGRDQGEGWGNHIVIRVNDRVKVRLAHFVKGWSKGFRKGQRINVGDYIALMGNSGDTRGETHLHEELLIDGVRVDPDLYRGPNGRHLPGTETPAGGDSKPLPAPDPVIPEEEEDDMGFAFKIKGDNSKPYYWFSFARGKSRRLSSDEVVQMRSAERSGIPGNTIHEVGAGWYENQLKLGIYES